VLLVLDAVEVLLASDEGDRKAVLGTVAQVVELRERIGAADGDDAAEQLRQRVGKSAGDAPAAGEAADIRTVGVDLVVLPYLEEHIEDDADALAGRTLVARPVRLAVEDALRFARLLPGVPAHRRVAGRHEDDERPGALRLVTARHKQLKVLLPRVVARP